MEQNFPILYYHFINAPNSNTRIKGLYTTPKHFEWQLRLLIKKGFNFITFEDIANSRYDKSKRNIILTFDDGCESLYNNAFPILKKYGIKAVIYVVAESIGARNILWEHNENKDPLNILSKDQIIEMTTCGIEFGSHLCNHIHLTSLTTNEMEYELFESKNLLENQLGQKLYSVAYPFGSYNNEVIEIASKAGYQFGVTTKIGNNLDTSNLELFRIPVKGYAFRHYLYFYKIFKSILGLRN